MRVRRTQEARRALNEEPRRQLVFAFVKGVSRVRGVKVGPWANEDSAEELRAFGERDSGDGRVRVREMREQRKREVATCGVASEDDGREVDTEIREDVC